MTQQKCRKRSQARMTALDRLTRKFGNGHEPPINLDGAITVRQFATLWGSHPETIRLALRRGLLPIQPIESIGDGKGKRIKFWGPLVKAFLSKQPRRRRRGASR